MPFESKQQAKWAFATGQPFATRWADMTNFAKLPQRAQRDRKFGRSRTVHKEAPGAPVNAYAGGPGGLFSASGLQGGKLRITHKSDDQEHTTAMLALYLPAQAATSFAGLGRALFGEAACPADDLHITLMYFGEMAAFEPYVVQTAVAIERFLSQWSELVGEPLCAEIGELDCFERPQSDGTCPIYYSVDSPSLHTFVLGLEQLFTLLGVPYRNDYGAFRPHVTIAYAPAGTLIPQRVVVPQHVTFTEVTLALGEVTLGLPLPQGESYKAEASEDGTPPQAPKKAKAPTSGVSAGSPGESGGGSLPAGVIRVRGNLCHVHGKFGPCDKATSTGFNAQPGKDKKARGGQGKGAGKGKGPKTPEQRAEERSQQQAANRQSVADQMADGDVGLSPSGVEAFTKLAAGEAIDKAMADGLVQMGLAEQGDDGVLRLTSAGKATMGAMNRGDFKGAVDAISRGGDSVNQKRSKVQERAAKDQERAAKQQAREAALAKREAEREKRQKAGGGGSRSGGGGGGSSAADQRRAEREAATQEKRASALRQTGLSEDEFGELQAASEGSATKVSDALRSRGFIEDGPDGPEATDAGRQAMRALMRGDIVGYQAALQNARQKMARDAKKREHAAPAPAPTASTAPQGPAVPKPNVSQDQPKTGRVGETAKEVGMGMSAITLKMVLAPDIQAMLNAQIGRELFAKSSYTSVAAWGNKLGYQGIARWASAQAAEEDEHANKQITYLNERGDVLIPAIPAPQCEFDRYPAVLQHLWDLEKLVSAALTQIVYTAREAGDEATALFIGSFLREQSEAEDFLRQATLKALRSPDLDNLDHQLFEEVG